MGLMSAYVYESIKFVGLVRSNTNTKCYNIIRGTKMYLVAASTPIYLSVLYVNESRSRWNRYLKIPKKLTNRIQ